MKPIASFCVDHRYIEPGVYLSRRDGDVVTYDLRTRKPNAGDYMDNVTMHSVEHLFATYARNSAYADRVVYFGPMGCRTGFYLLVRDMNETEVWELILDVLDKCACHTGPMFGQSEIECGNYRELSAEAGTGECASYREALLKKGMDFTYPKGDEQ